MDSSLGKDDTGLKLTIMLIINNDKEIDRKYGKLTLFK
jgi:hypothetical protein